MLQLHQHHQCSLQLHLHHQCLFCVRVQRILELNVKKEEATPPMFVSAPSTPSMLFCVQEARFLEYSPGIRRNEEESYKV